MNKYVGYGLGGVVLLGLSFATGRYTVPTKIEEKVKIKDTTVVVEKIDTKRLEELSTQIQRALSQLEQIKTSIHREKISTTYPDGRIELSETEDINIDRTVKTVDVLQVEKQVVVVEEKIVEKQVLVTKEIDKLKIVTAQKPQWKLTPMVGVNLADIRVAQSLTSGPFVFGGSISKRIVGPVFVGVWGLSSGQVGIQATVEF